MMAQDKSKFLIVLRTGSSKPKPQHQSVHLAGQPWNIEWSTHSEIPMAVDYFNVTIGRYFKSESGTEEGASQKRIEEYWRITQIPPGVRKIVYSVNPAEAISTPAKPLEDGIYAIKITGMTILAVGLEVQTAVGIAIVKIETAGIMVAPLEVSQNLDRAQSKKAIPEPVNHTAAAITGETISKLLDLLEDEDQITP